MREIKFRGKRCSDGKWVYGSYLESDLSWAGHKPHKSWIVCSAFSNGGWLSLMGRYAVKDDTIGQFTGLRDKKGKEIYEGDILFVQYDDDSHGIAVVGWNGKKARFGVMDNRLYNAKVGEYSSHVLLDFLNNAVKSEVIGNKWDNPKLLES